MFNTESDRKHLGDLLGAHKHTIELVLFPFIYYPIVVPAFGLIILATIYS